MAGAIADSKPGADGVSDAASRVLDKGLKSGRYVSNLVTEVADPTVLEGVAR